MINFNPKYVGCPACNTKPKQYRSSSLSAYKRTTNGTLIGRCGHEFTLFDSLISQCKNAGIFGIINCFSHWSANKTELIESGKVNIISFPVPSEYTIFSIFMVQNGGSNDVLCFPKIIEVKEDEIIISCAASKNVPTALLGRQIEMQISAYAYASLDSPGWKKLFYEGIRDFSENNYSMAVFKLATSLEGYCEATVRNYLRRKDIGEKLIDQILKSSKSWHSRINHFKEIAESFLEKSELLALNASIDFFATKVRPFRNKFAHDNPEKLDHKECDDAFENAFPILWGMDRVNKSVSE